MAEIPETPSLGMNGNAVMEKSAEMSVEFVAAKPSEEMLPQNSAAKPSEDVLLRSSEMLPQNAAVKASEDVSPKPSEASGSKLREISPSKPSESTGPESLKASGEEAASSSTRYRLFNRQKTIHEVLGGGHVADVILWRKHRICTALLIGGDIVRYILEPSGFSFISIVSSALLFAFVLLFTWAKTARRLQRPLPILPHLTLSEETVTRGAAKLCEQINCVLTIAHELAHGRNNKLFVKVVSILILLSVIGGMFNFLTLVYFCLLFCLTVPALYNEYEDHVDRHAERALREIVKQKEVAQRHILKHYKNIDEKVISKISRGVSNIYNVSNDKAL